LLLPLLNVLHRRKDPTRHWHSDPSQLTIDIAHCTLANIPLGGPSDSLSPLGPSENARQSARGYPAWYSKGLSASIEHHRLADFIIYLRPAKPFRPFTGKILCNNNPTSLSPNAKIAEVVSLLDEPFARSKNDWDSATVLFYETPTGEAQFAFDKETGKLISIECWYEPELSQPGACQTYGIERDFPDNLRRTLTILD